MKKTFFVLTMIALFTACKKNDTPTIVLPTVTTNPVSAVSAGGATTGGTITSQGSAAVTARGVVWGTNANPTIDLSTKTSDGSGAGTYTSVITGLLPNNTYHVREYATSSAGTAYGNDITFTSSANQPPVCSITSPANNASLSTSDTITVKVTASDADGSIAKVEMYVDDVLFGNPKTNAPFEFAILPGALVAGTHRIKAVATDNQMASKADSVTLSVVYTPTVYVSGYENNSAVSVAKYWKNGSPVALTDGTKAAAAYSLFVSNNDIYAAGYEYQANTSLAKYWKNGTAIVLGANASEAKAIFVNGTDVYVGGWEIISGFDLPRYWKNGTASTVSVYDPIISQTVTGNGSCNALYVNNNNIYAVGSYRNSQGRFSPWEMLNGTLPAATIPNNDKHCFVNAAFVNGSDKYVAGTQNNATTGLAMATIWKNNAPVLLSTGSTSVGVATSVFVSGNDVYVAGYEYDYPNGVHIAKYWKNNVPVLLSNGTSEAHANAITVFGNDVYVAGYEGNKAKYWKNGIGQNLTDGTHPGAAFSIVVK